MVISVTGLQKDIILTMQMACPQHTVIVRQVYPQFFIAAGKGIKEGYRTERYIRQVDVAPTMAALMNVRMPAQCEGAPVYQILEEEF